MKHKSHAGTNCWCFPEDDDGVLAFFCPLELSYDVEMDCPLRARNMVNSCFVWN
jgi:hypothetical protein